MLASGLCHLGKDVNTEEGKQASATSSVAVLSLSALAFCGVVCTEYVCACVCVYVCVHVQEKLLPGFVNICGRGTYPDSVNICP